jgi:hypothetical protein
MSVNLTVANPISGANQPVQGGADSALYLSTDTVYIQGKDVPNVSLPLQVVQSVSGSGTWGRVLRLQGPERSQFFDFGIDTNGNLFLNGPQSTQTTHLLTISPSGVITVG